MSTQVELVHVNQMIILVIIISVLLFKHSMMVTLVGQTGKPAGPQ